MTFFNLHWLSVEWQDHSFFWTMQRPGCYLLERFIMVLSLQYYIATRAYRQLGLIRRTFSASIPVNIKKQLNYLSLVQSQLSYCSPVWRPHLIKDIKFGESIQCRVTKYIHLECKSHRSPNFATDVSLWALWYFIFSKKLHIHRFKFSSYGLYPIYFNIN